MSYLFSISEQIYKVLQKPARNKGVKRDTLTSCVFPHIYLLRGVVAVGLFAALLSAIPVLRPWEYFNETIGGTANGYRYFSDEGVEIGQRTKELAAYYKENLEPHGEIPEVEYFATDVSMRSRGLDWVANKPERDAERMESEVKSGTFIMGATAFSPKKWGDISENFSDSTIRKFICFSRNIPSAESKSGFALFPCGL
jgi:hypothetical protein